MVSPLIIPFERASDTYCAYQLLSRTSSNGILRSAIGRVHHVVRITILRNSARVRLSFGRYWITLFMIPRITSLLIYPFAQLFPISRKLTSEILVMNIGGILNVPVGIVTTTFPVAAVQMPSYHYGHTC